MNDIPTERLKYPIGRFQWPHNISPEEIESKIQEIATFPQQLRAQLAAMNPSFLQESYRPGGWTIQQLLHHVADSHTNAYIRFKWALTEDAPTIKAYDEKAWALTPEIQQTPVEESVHLLEALHKRWVSLLKSLSPTDWSKTFVHPESGKIYTLGVTVALYAWHGKHHLAHITEFEKRNRD
ncbi:MAG: YfiT family bacillithiol transferase [Bacteroidota bacterium]